MTYKVYKQRCKQQENGKHIQNLFKVRCEKDNLKKEAKCKTVDGRRIVYIETLGEQLICFKCNCILSLTDTVEEKNVGLASIFYVRCRECKMISSACTDKQHITEDQNIHFDTNTKGVIGLYS